MIFFFITLDTILSILITENSNNLSMVIRVKYYYPNLHNITRPFIIAHQMSSIAKKFSCEIGDVFQILISKPIT